ncbi:hypothetical protein GC167_01970 [bacterium]|nr:hypothetical protein [bacterium]
MERFNAAMERLERAFEMVMAQRVALHEENRKLSDEVQRLGRLLERQSEKCTALEKEVDSMKLAAALSGDDTRRNQARAELNYMLREIDQCLALLND